MDKLDLTNIRVAFVDFDDTAIVHLDHTEWKEWFRDCFNGVDDVYRYGEWTVAMPGMSSLLRQLKECGIDAYCLTWCSTSIAVRPKTAVLKKAYGEEAFTDVITVGYREKKVEFIMEYCEAFGVLPSEVLLVDDNAQTISEAIARGITIATPQEVVCRYT